MEVLNIVTNAVKDVVAVGQSVSVAVKEEVEMYFEAKKNTMGDVATDARETIENSKFYARFEELEERVKETIDASFSKLNFSKSDEHEKMEQRISSLEGKLEELLETIKKNNA